MASCPLSEGTRMDFYAVENGELICYRRIGECNQCGECCRGKSTITFRVDVGAAKKAEEEEEFDWSPWEGWNIFQAQGLWWYFKIWLNADKETSCESLTEDGRCSIHEEFIKKPAICTYWPMHPNHVTAFPSCSYTFERIDTDALGTTDES